MRIKKFDSNLIFLFLIILVNILILANITFFPYPETFIYTYLTNHGLIPYKDIIDQHFPGLLFLPINLNSLGMNSPQSAHIVQYVFVMLDHISLYVVAKKFFKSGKWALFANMLYLVWQPFFEGYVLWVDSFVPPLLLFSFYFLDAEEEKKNHKHSFYSGLFLGIALVFKQVVVPIAAAVVIYRLIEKRFKEAFLYSLGVFIPVFLMLAYVVTLGAFRDFFYWTVTFNLTTFAKIGRKYPTISLLAKSALIYLVAAISLLYGFFKKEKDLLLALAIFFVGSLAFAYARFDYVHLQPSLPFAVLAFTYLIKKLPRKTSLILMTIYLFPTLYLLTKFYKSNIGGETLFWTKSEIAVSNEVSKYAHKGDTVFALGTMPDIYQMTDTLPPGKVFVMQFPWFMLKAENKIFAGIIKDPPKVVVRDIKSEADGYNLVSYMPKISDYVNANYVVEKNINGIDVMLRK